MSGDATVDVTVRAIAAGGSGVGSLPDGRVVFVPRTAPGDRARIRVRKEKRRWAVGSLQRLIRPGPDRCEPPCALYAECGGCQLQHLGYERQLEWKARFVADALARLGGLELEPPEVVPSPARTGYRSRMSYTLRRLTGGRIVAGFHGLARPAHVVDVRDECVLPEPAVSEAWLRLRDAWGAGARLLPAAGRLRLTLRSACAGVELLVEGGQAGWDPSGLVSAVPDLAAVTHRPSGDGEGAKSDHGTSGDAGAGSFEQVNRTAAELLRAHVLDVAGEGSTAVDAYCGAGELGRALAGGGWRVVGIEIDAAAAAAVAEGAPAGLTVIRGRVEEVLASHLPADLLVVNPPRAGLDPEVPAIIRSRSARRLLYVSCDPATLARDVRALGDAYRLTGLRAFDLFPQTAHVETVAVLEAR